jgi:hypothetical protein
MRKAGLTSPALLFGIANPHVTPEASSGRGWSRIPYQSVPLELVEKLLALEVLKGHGSSLPKNFKIGDWSLERARLQPRRTSFPRSHGTARKRLRKNFRFVSGYAFRHAVSR